MTTPAMTLAEEVEVIREMRDFAVQAGYEREAAAMTRLIEVAERVQQPDLALPPCLAQCALDMSPSEIGAYEYGITDALSWARGKR